MNFDELVAPIGKDQFFANFAKGACMLIRGERDRFADLISLEEIELRINDGCNNLTPVQMIGSGRRAEIIDKQLAWSAIATRKSELLQMLRDKHSFLMMNMSQINPRIAALVDSVEAAFPNDSVQADLHLYVSTRADASGYDAHRDFPQHKLYLQAIGSTHWQVFETTKELSTDVRAVAADSEADCLKLAREFDLNPGDAFYMPPAVFHKVRNQDGPRVSLSIPFVKITNPDVPRMDRTYVPFRELFEGES